MARRKALLAIKASLDKVLYIIILLPAAHFLVSEVLELNKPMYFLLFYDDKDYPEYIIFFHFFEILECISHALHIFIRFCHFH